MYTIETYEDQNGWNTFFSQIAPEALFQSWEWGEVQRKAGNQISRFGIWKQNELVGIFQVVKVFARRGAFLHVRHGPILKEYSTDVLEAFTHFFSKYAKKEKVLFFRISPLILPEQETLARFKALQYSSAAIHAMDAELCWVLPLQKTSEELLLEMRKTTRYEIKKAQKMGIVIHSSKDIQDFHYFSELYKETTKRHKFVGHTGISEEFEIYANANQALLYYAEYEKTVIAAAIILFVGNQGIYHHGASLPSSPPGSYLIQWEAILETKKRGKNQYNFWGIAPENSPDHPWKGITLFKKGFGGNIKQYMHAQDYPVSPLYIVPHGIEIIRKLRKGY